MGYAGHKHQITGWNGNISGKPSAFGANGIFHHLHHYILTIANQVADIMFFNMTGRNFANYLVMNNDVGCMQKCRFIQTDVHKGRLHTG